MESFKIMKKAQLKLRDVLEKLSKLKKEKVFKKGFGKPMSYRGYYDELAFEPKENVSVGEMIAHCNDALERPFYGYKGGMFEMDMDTPCWLAEYGDCGKELTEDFFK